MKSVYIVIVCSLLIMQCLSTNTTNSTNTTSEGNVCSQQLIDKVGTECLYSTGKTMAFFTCFRNKLTDIPNCYTDGCTMLQNQYKTFSCPPQALENCTNATVFPLASTCYAWSNQTYKWLECMQWYLFNTPGCIDKVCNYTAENYPELKCPENLNNFTEKFETQLFTYSPEQYSYSYQNQTNQTTNSSLVCAPETVQPLVMQCFNKTGKTLKFYNCLQQVLASSPDCYEHTCQYMESKITGFSCPPSAITSCSNESVYEMNQKCMQWANNSDAKWYECMKFYLYNSQECLYQVCQNPSEFSSEKYACPQLNQQYAQFMTNKNTECNEQTVKPIVQECYNKTGNNTDFFTCLKSSLANIENCYETSCHYLEEHTTNIKCPPKKLEKCSFETVSPIVTKCLKKTGNNIQWYDCIKWYLFETEGCYKTQCAKFAKTLKGFKCPDV